MTAKYATGNLLNAATTNGAGEALEITNTRRDKANGSGSIAVWGSNFDGATVQIQVSPDNVEWIDVTDGAFTETGTKVMENYLPYVRANVSGAGGSTSVSASYI